MEPQVYNWTCSICSYHWVLGATGTADIDRLQAGEIIGYPYCVNETYGLMSSDCMINAFLHFGLQAKQKWCTFEEAYAICSTTTGVINPQGMYHFMAIRGVSSAGLWLANSAQGYCGVYDSLSRSQFNQLGPVQLIWIV